MLLIGLPMYTVCPSTIWTYWDISLQYCQTVVSTNLTSHECHLPINVTSIQRSQFCSLWITGIRHWPLLTSGTFFVITEWRIKPLLQFKMFLFAKCHGNKRKIPQKCCSHTKMKKKNFIQYELLRYLVHKVFRLWTILTFRSNKEKENLEPSIPGNMFEWDLEIISLQPVTLNSHHHHSTDSINKESKQKSH